MTGDRAITPRGVGPQVPPRSIRAFVYAFLVAFVVCGLLSIEFWPLTGWRLFHETRGATREGWAVAAVTEDGGEVTIDFDQLPVAYHNTTKLIDGFDDLPRGDRDEICEDWAEAAETSQGITVDVVHIYRFERPVWTDRDAPRPDATRTLRYTCAGDPP